MPDSWRRRADDALVTLARDRWTILTGYAFLLTGDRQEAEDLVQEALVRTFARSRSINPAAMEGYVRRAILTVYIDGHRRRRRWRDRMHLLVPPQAHDGPDAAVGQGIEVRDALAALPRQQRACVVLRFYDELSIQEVADTLGLGVGTVKRYLSLAMRHLEAQLGPVRPAEVGAGGRGRPGARWAPPQGRRRERPSPPARRAGRGSSFVSLDHHSLGADLRRSHRPELGLQMAHGQAQVPLDGSDAQAEGVGDLLDGELVVEAQDDAGALLAGKGRQRVPDLDALADRGIGTVVGLGWHEQVHPVPPPATAAVPVDVHREDGASDVALHGGRVDRT